jgi:hypothetical protein
MFNNKFFFVKNDKSPIDQVKKDYKDIVDKLPNRETIFLKELYNIINLEEHPNEKILMKINQRMMALRENKTDDVSIHRLKT